MPANKGFPFPATGESLFADRRGNTTMTFALTLLPLVMFVGAAVDYGRGVNARAQLQQAADAAVLAGAQANPSTLANAQAEASKVFNSYFGASNATMTLTQPGNGITRVAATLSLSTSFMQLAQISSIDIDVSAEAQAFSAGAIEVALALDNTGSMVNDMASLKTAATNLVNSLFASAAGNPNFKMSVVPFVAAVNPGKAVLTANSNAMIDVNGQSKWHGQPMKWQWVAQQANCTPNWGGGGGGGGSSGPGSGGTGAQLFDIFDPVNKFAYEIFGVKPALADSGVTPGTMIPLSGGNNGPHQQFVPTGFGTYAGSNSGSGGCDWLYNPGTISHWDLFQRIPTTTITGGAFNGWKGCVEARPNLSDGASKDYDVTDDPPTSDANSKFVPYFWMDETDQFDTGWVPLYSNNWLADGTLKNSAVNDDPTGNPTSRPANKTWSGMSGDVWRRAFNLLKYNGVNKAQISENGINTTGPNKACPDAVLPLTNVKTDVLNKINGLTYWNGGGTIVSEGVAWAWRTISPNLPYANGQAYAPTVQKVIVLMTDGKNELGENGRDFWGNIDWSPYYSDYNAYGYLRNGRFPNETFTAATSYLNQRLTAVCTNAKAKGILVYTVLFRETDATIKSLLQNCASKPEYAFLATNGADLNAAFGQIGSSISKLRIRR